MKIARLYCGVENVNRGLANIILQPIYIAPGDTISSLKYREITL